MTVMTTGEPPIVTAEQMEEIIRSEKRKINVRKAIRETEKELIRKGILMPW